MQLVDHGAVFVALLQRFEHGRKQPAAHGILQFGKAQNQLVPVLHGFIVHRLQVGRRKGQRALHGLQGVPQMVPMPHTLLPGV